MTEENRSIRVLIVDDTVLYRSILTKALSALPNVEVIGAVASGELALKKLAQVEVDLVFLDVFMPGMSGVETLQQIRKDYPNINMVMVSGVATNDAEVTIQALHDGALDFIPKPKEKSVEDSMRVITEDITRVLRVVRMRGLPKIETKPLTAPQVEPPVVVQPKISIKPAKFDFVLIGVSTGGPNALSVVIPALPKDLNCPVLLVQHMPPIFTASLADHLGKKSALQVKEGRENEPIIPGTVWIAPGGKHMIIKRDERNLGGFAIALNENPPVNSCRPAVDVLFRSVAENVTGGVLAVILTGMGEDGTAGVAALKRRSCYCLAQDEKTSVVYGMPRMVAEKGWADEILPLEGIAPRIATLVKHL